MTLSVMVGVESPTMPRATPPPPACLPSVPPAARLSEIVLPARIGGTLPARVNVLRHPYPPPPEPPHCPPSARATLDEIVLPVRIGAESMMKTPPPCPVYATSFCVSATLPTMTLFERRGLPFHAKTPPPA